MRRVQPIRMLTLAVMTVALGAGAPPALEATATLELYGNFHTMGVIATVDAADDPDEDAVATLSYRTGAQPFTAGLPLARTRSTQFVGSLFELVPGTTYDVQVTLSEPDGGPLDGVVLSQSETTRAEISIPAPLASHWVSPSGAGSACSEIAPCSLTQGLQQAMPGDEVLLRGGVYMEGEISLPRSGAPGAPIVLHAADGETPIFDGSDPQDFTWVHEGDGVWVTTVNVPDTHLVVAGGERLYPYQSLGDLQALSWGIPGFFSDGTTLHVHLAGGADPNPLAMRVSRFNHALSIDSLDYVYLVGLTFRFYGQGSFAKAIYLNGSSDGLVRNCTFEVCDLGIGLKRQADRNVIESSTFSDTIFDWTWEAVKAGAALETGGIRIYDWLPSGRGTVIRGNTFHDFFDGFGVCPDSDTGTTIETDVHDNVIYDVGDDGFETDGYCSNLRIWRNTIHDALMGISLAPVYTGPVYAIRNLVYGVGAGTSQAGYTGSCFKFNSGYAQSGFMFLLHNTCDAARAGNDALAIKSPGSWALVYARNNIWSATDHAIDNANPGEPLDLDYDDLFTTRPGELAWWSGLSDTHLNTLTELRTATGLELHGLNEAPGFWNAGAGDYALGAGSLLVDAGVVIPGVNDGWSGTGPDLGAFEREAALFADDFESGDLSSWSRSAP